MALTFDQAASLPGGRRVYFITIEGIGSAAGLDRFCDKVPAYAAGNVLWKAWVPDGLPPEPVPQEIHPLGGVATSGAFTFEVADGVGRPGDTLHGYLTDQMGDDTEPDGFVSTDYTAAGATLAITSDDPTQFEINTIVYSGAEALLITGIVSTISSVRTVNVTGAQLDTEAADHDAGDAVYLRTPFVKGRLVRFYVTYDEPDAGATTEQELGDGWTISRTPQLVQGLKAYAFESISNGGYVDSTILKNQFRGTLSSVASPAGDAVEFDLIYGPQNISPANASHFAPEIWLKHQDEVFLALWPSGGRPRWVAPSAFRAAANTPGAEFEDGEEIVQVLAAETRGGFGSFRMQDPGGETSSRSTGTWTDIDHPIGIALNVMLSSRGNDGLAVTNYVSGSGNFSALPEGYGLGIPIADVDYASAHEIWALHPEWRLPNLVISEPVTGRDFLNDEILRPFGVALIVIDGQLTFVEDDPLNIVATGASWTKDDIVLRRVGVGMYEPVLEQKKDDELAVTEVHFIARGAGGGEARLTFSDRDFEQLFENVRGKNALAHGGPVEIPVMGARFDGQGQDEFFERRAFSILRNSRRPPEMVHASTPFTRATTVLFSTIQLTHPELVNRVTRSRGWTSVPCAVRSKKLDTENGKVDFTLRANLRAGRIGLVSPAARISTVATNTITCTTNRVTTSGLPSGLSLPSEDVSGFTVGDVVRLRDTDGSIVSTSPATQIVQSIAPGSDQITLDGDFGSTMASGHTLVFADWDSQVTQQHTFVSWADADHTLGSSDDVAFVYAEA